jgi:hypothetical protein
MIVIGFGSFQNPGYACCCPVKKKIMLAPPPRDHAGPALSLKKNVPFTMPLLKNV